MGEEKVYFKSDEEVWNIHWEVFWIEVKKLIPFNELQITEWTQILQDIQKKIDAVLTKNANKHSSDFVSGMDIVHGVKNDLSSSKEIA